MKLEEIKRLPTCYHDSKTGETHESLLRSFQELQKIGQMIKRGDSKETILEAMDYLGYYP